MLAILDPLAAGFYTGWTSPGGPADVRLPDNEDTDYADCADSAARQSYTMDPLPADAIGIIGHTVKNRTRKFSGSGSASISGFIRKAGVDTDGSIVVATGSYVTRSDVDLLTLTVAQVNAAEVGIWGTSMAAQILRCTTLSWEVSYNPSPGGFVAMVCELLGAAVLGANLLMRDAVALANAMLIRSRGRMQVIPSELPTLLAELRAWRHVAIA